MYNIFELVIFTGLGVMLIHDVAKNLKGVNSALTKGQIYHTILVSIAGGLLIVGAVKNYVGS